MGLKSVEGVPELMPPISLECQGTPECRKTNPGGVPSAQHVLHSIPPRVGAA